MAIPVNFKNTLNIFKTELLFPEAEPKDTTVENVIKNKRIGEFVELESGFLKTEIGQAEENERWEVDNIIRTVTEDLIVDNLEFNDYIDDFAE